MAQEPKFEKKINVPIQNTDSQNITVLLVKLEHLQQGMDDLKADMLKDTENIKDELHNEIKLIKEDINKISSDQILIRHSVIRLETILTVSCAIITGIIALGGCIIGIIQLYK